VITCAEYSIDISCRRFTKLLVEWVDHIHKFDSIHTAQMLSSEGGYPIVHQQVNAGVPMVAARSLYNCLYHGKEGEELIPLGGPIPEDEGERYDRGFTYLLST